MKHKLQTMLKHKLQWLLLLAALLGVSQGAWAWGWAARCTENQSSENPTYYVGDEAKFWWCLDGTANGADFKRAFIQTDQTSTDNPLESFYWSEDGCTTGGSYDSNKYTWFASATVTSDGTWYYGVFIGWGSMSNGHYYNGNSSWNEGSSSLSGSSFTVNALPNPTSQGSSASGTTATVTWTRNSTYTTVMVVRYTGALPSVTAPTGGTSYSSGSTIGDGTVVYKGTSTTGYSDTDRTAGTTYTYYLYTVNNNYYSSGVYTSVTIPAGCDQPEMATPTAGSETNTSVTMGVKATSIGDCTISKWGLKAWTSSACSGAAAFTEEIDNATTELTTSNQNVTITGLTANTTYYFKSYVELDDETIVVSDSYTQRNTKIAAPSVNNATVSSSTAATISGSTTSNGSAVTTMSSAAGFIYSTDEDDVTTPNVSEGHATFVSSGNVTSVGSNFSYTFSGLSANTTYYYRSRIIYSTNGGSVTEYSSATKSFTTNSVFGTVSIDNNGVSSVCLGSGTITWNASASSGSPTSWTVNSSNTAKATATITDAGVITITPVAAGTSTITATAKKAGYDDKTSAGVTITVNSLPTITLDGDGPKSGMATYPWEWFTVTATTSESRVEDWGKTFVPESSASEPDNSVETTATTYRLKSAITTDSGDKYTITGTVTDANGCENSAEYDFYINDAPVESCE